MSASNEYTEWHLTPSGWKEGTTRVDFKGTTKVVPPPDRVLSVLCRAHMSSMHSPINYTVEEMWNCGDRARINELLKKFGEKTGEDA